MNSHPLQRRLCYCLSHQTKREEDQVSEAKIHSTAVISAEAQIDPTVSIGPYSVVEGPVQLAAGCVVGPHCYLSGHTLIGENTQIFKGASVGDVPQDHSFASGTVSYTEIGANCAIREYVTIHRAADEGGRTVIGDHCMIMDCTHVAHNCLLADHVNVANNVILAGHIEVGPRAFISGAVVMQQFVRVGTLAMVGAQARIPKDIPPYCMIGKGSVVSGANVIGLKRAEIGPSARKAIRSALRQIYFSADTLPTQAVEQVAAEFADCPEVQVLVEFIRSAKRGTMAARRGPRDDA